MRKFKNLIWLICIILPQLAFAADNNGLGDKLSGLAPGMYDKSVAYLSDVFGTVPGVLHGTSGNLLSTVFGVFNIGVLIAASIFIGYSIFRSVVDTANEGNFMGQGKNAAYISLRAAGGVGLLTPMFNGYSAVQVLVMFIVLHGAGFADRAWSKTLDYLQQGGVVFQPPQAVPKPIIKTAGDLLYSQTCMMRSKVWYEQHAKKVRAAAEKDPKNPILQQQVEQLQSSQGYWQPYYNDKKKIVEFPGGSQDSLAKNACGSVSWDINKDDNKNAPKYAKLAVQQMLITLQPVAEDLASIAPANQQTIISITSKRDKKKEAESAILGAAADYLNVTVPARNNPMSGKKQILDQFYKRSKREGWITAGGYYFNLALLKTTLDSATNYNLRDWKGPNLDDFSDSGNNNEQSQIKDFKSQINAYADSAVNAAVKQKYDDNDSTPGTGGPGGGWLNQGDYQFAGGQDWKEAAKWFKEFGVGGVGSAVAGGVAGFFKGSWDEVSQGRKLNIIQQLFGPMFAEPVKGWLELLVGYKTDGTKLPNDPMVRIQQYGYDLMTYIPKSLQSQFANAIAWLFDPWSFPAPGGGLMGVIISALMTVGKPLFEPVIKLLMLLAMLPFYFILATLFFTVGAVLAFYIPLIPFIFFTVGAVGWVISVIEAMVAAPLVAMGITHPEGHDLLGKSEQSVMLLLSVFVRPITMIIGLLSGMVLSYVAVYILNAGFGQIVETFMAAKGNIGASWGIVKFAMPIAMMGIYAFLMVALVQKSYSLIYVIPEKIMRWIGLTPEHESDAAQIVQQGQGMVSSGAGRAAEGVKASGGAVLHAARTAGEMGAKAAAGGG